MLVKALDLFQAYTQEKLPQVQGWVPAVAGVSQRNVRVVIRWSSLPNETSDGGAGSGE